MRWRDDVFNGFFFAHKYKCAINCVLVTHRKSDCSKGKAVNHIQNCVWSKKDYKIQERLRVKTTKHKVDL